MGTEVRLVEGANGAGRTGQGVAGEDLRVLSEKSDGGLDPAPQIAAEQHVGVEV